MRFGGNSQEENQITLNRLKVKLNKRKEEEICLEKI